MRPTPLTDNQILTVDCSAVEADIYLLRKGKVVHDDIVPAEFARRLERKIARLEREIADMGRGD